MDGGKGLRDERNTRVSLEQTTTNSTHGEF